MLDTISDCLNRFSELISEVIALAKILSEVIAAAPEEIFAYSFKVFLGYVKSSDEPRNRAVCRRSKIEFTVAVVSRVFFAFYNLMLFTAVLF